MIKKATLLLRNIHRLYTGEEINHRMIVLSHAYIGMYHDKIIEIGIGDDHHLIDKDTRIIDSNTHIVIPGFVDCAVTMPICLPSDFPRICNETLMDAMRQGVTTMNVQQPEPLYSYQHFYYEVVWNTSYRHAFPIIDIDAILQDCLLPKHYCITSSYCSNSPLKTAQLLYAKYHMDPIQLLKALTTYPANMLALPRGKLQVGCQGDLLLINATCLEALFSTFRDDMIYQVIKNGVRIYPNVLV